MTVPLCMVVFCDVILFKNIKDRSCVLRRRRCFRLLPQCPRGLCSLGMLHGIGWQLVTDISGQSICLNLPIYTL